MYDMTTDNKEIVVIGEAIIYMYNSVILFEK